MSSLERQFNNKFVLVLEKFIKQKVVSETELAKIFAGRKQELKGYIRFLKIKGFNIKELNVHKKNGFNKYYYLK